MNKLHAYPNNNLSKWKFQGDTIQFDVGTNSEAPLFFKIRSKETDFYQLTALSGGLELSKTENGAWTSLWKAASKDDLGVAEYNAGKSIKISGRLSDIGKWLQTNGTTSRWMSVRANPTNTDGYFGSSTFSILWQCSSAEYGWCILMSDNSKMVVFGRNSDGWHWYAPSLTEVS